MIQQSESKIIGGPESPRNYPDLKFIIAVNKALAWLVAVAFALIGILGMVGGVGVGGARDGFAGFLIFLIFGSLAFLAWVFLKRYNELLEIFVRIEENAPNL